MTDNQELRIQGTPICTGIAIGRPFLFFFSDEKVPEFFIQREEISNEIERYRSALSTSKKEIEHLQKQLELDGAHEGVDILDTHLQIMHDDLITGYLETQIKSTQKNAEFVFRVIMNDYEEKMSCLTGSVFKERIKDVQDISKRIMRNLKKSAKITLADIPANSIVFASDLSPSEAAEAQKTCVGAFVTEHGGATSHAAIIARSKGIPYVSSVCLEDLPIGKDHMVIVDGRLGEVIINPTQQTLASYQSTIYDLEMQAQSLNKKGALNAETIDGYQIKLSANVELIAEVEDIHHYEAEGIGLFRSEYICLGNNKVPDEEKQFIIYKQLVESLKGKALTIRTFDIGGDKGCFSLPYEEPNPFLGCRGIRLLLSNPDLFKAQLRAIFRASAYGQIRLMFPMITSTDEVLQAKALCEEVQQELNSLKIPYDKQLKIGCMIEVPSAALTCDELVKHCDFLSIGTNDLVQYALAVDRGNQLMSDLYNPADPSVIRLIKMIVLEASRHNVPVSVCGEMAADPAFTALLLGLGVNELSCSTRHLPLVKNVIRKIRIVNAYQMAEEVLCLSTRSEVQKRLKEEYQNVVPHNVLHNSLIQSS